MGHSENEYKLKKYIAIGVSAIDISIAYGIIAIIRYMNNTQVSISDILVIGASLILGIVFVIKTINKYKQVREEIDSLEK